jgi:hypothetical protein
VCQVVKVHIRLHEAVHQQLVTEVGVRHKLDLNAAATALAPNKNKVGRVMDRRVVLDVRC